MSRRRQRTYILQHTNIVDRTETEALTIFEAPQAIMCTVGAACIQVTRMQAADILGQYRRGANCEVYTVDANGNRRSRVG